MKKEYWVILGVLAVASGAAYFYFRRSTKLPGVNEEGKKVLGQIKIV